jgi:hypothetical protein
MLIKRGFPGDSGLKSRQRGLLRKPFGLIPTKKGGQSCEQTDRPGKSEDLLQVAALSYGSLNLSLTRLERLIDRHLAGQSGSDVLAYLETDRLKLRYSDKLHTDIGTFLIAGFVGLVNSSERQVS